MWNWFKSERRGNAISNPKDLSNDPCDTSACFDVAIVLGAAVNPDGTPSAALLRRVSHAAKLYLGGRVAKLLMSGGVGRSPPAEAVLMRDAAIRAGVPESAILIEERSRNTLENAAFCRSFVTRHGWRRLLVVSDDYHLPRALYTFRRFGMIVEGEAAPQMGASMARLLARIREIPARIVYRRRISRFLSTASFSGMIAKK